jgi:hypothetical protein
VTARTKKDDDKVAGTDQSKTSQTSAQAEDNEVDEKATESGKTDVKGAASGSVVGGVVDGDSGFYDDDLDKDDRPEAEIKDDKVEGAVGTVVEHNRDGDQFDVPYTYLTPEYLPRTADSDDPAVDWTAQHATGERKDDDGNDLDPVALVPVQGIPGQTFEVSELPNREVAEAAGIDYDQWVAGLPVRATVKDAAPRRGIPA